MPGRKGQRSGGHNAKTTAEHIRDGTYQPSRHGKRVDKTPAKGKPTKPSGLSKLESSLWDEVVRFLPDGCVGGADTMALRELCRWYRLYRDAIQLWEKAPLDKDARLAATAAWDRFWNVAKDFGCTPVARTRLQLHDDGDKPDDPLAALRRLAESRN